MKISSLALAVLVVLATGSPTVALAEYERMGVTTRNSVFPIQSLTLYVIVLAILGVVLYSGWQAYRIRRRYSKREPQRP